MQKLHFKFCFLNLLQCEMNFQLGLPNKLKPYKKYANPITPEPYTRSLDKLILAFQLPFY